MNLIAFQTLRNGLRMNAAPATNQVRQVLEAGLREELLATGFFEDVEIGASDDEERLVVALGTYRAGVDEELVAGAVARVWSRLAFHHWEAHAFLTDEGHVEFQAATLDRPAGRFVTVHLVAQRSVVPDVSVDGLELVASMPEQRHVEAPVLAQSA
jgi:hypothetical protein